MKFDRIRKRSENELPNGQKKYSILNVLECLKTHIISWKLN